MFPVVMVAFLLILHMQSFLFQLSAVGDSVCFNHTTCASVQRQLFSQIHLQSEKIKIIWILVTVGEDTHGPSNFGDLIF